MLLKPYSLHLILRQPFFRPIIELGGARAFMPRHFLGVLQSPPIGEIGGDAGRAEGVIANRRRDADRQRTPADHPPGIGLRNRLLG